MNDTTFQPHGENLRNAIKWLSQQRSIRRDIIEKASLKFDLTPLEEDFLIRKFIQVKNHE